MFTEAILPLKHANIAIKHWNPGAKKTILALHGWLDNLESFTPLAPYLKDYSLIAIDWPGHGYSSHRPPGIYHVLDFVYDVFEVIAALKLSSVTLLGHSMGGALGAVFSGAFPTLIEKLILIDALGPLSQQADEAPERLQKTCMGLHKIESKSLPFYSSIDEAAKARAASGHLTFEAALLLAKRGTKPKENGVTWCTDPRLMLPPALMPTEEQVLAFLKKIQAPTLLIQPNNGYPYPHEETPRKNAIASLLVVQLEGQHHLHMESPSMVAETIVKFLED